MPGETIKGRFHYGLDFAMHASKQEVDAVIKVLSKPNRRAKETKLTENEKKMLRVGLKERMKTRLRKEAERRGRFPK